MISGHRSFAPYSFNGTTGTSAMRYRGHQQPNLMGPPRQRANEPPIVHFSAPGITAVPVMGGVDLGSQNTTGGSSKPNPSIQAEGNKKRREITRDRVLAEIGKMYDNKRAKRGQPALGQKKRTKRGAGVSDMDTESESDED